MRNNRRWKKVCAAFLAAACFSGTVSQGFCGSSFVCAEETETETEAETVYSQKDLELLENVDMAVYHVKRNGKNGIKVFDTLVQEELSGKEGKSDHEHIYQEYESMLD